MSFFNKVPRELELQIIFESLLLLFIAIIVPLWTKQRSMLVQFSVWNYTLNNIENRVVFETLMKAVAVLPHCQLPGKAP